MDEGMGEVDTSYISYNVCLALICRSMGRGQIAGVTAEPETLQTRLVIFIKWKGMNQILRRRNWSSLHGRNQVVRQKVKPPFIIANWRKK